MSKKKAKKNNNNSTVKQVQSEEKVNAQKALTDDNTDASSTENSTAVPGSEERSTPPAETIKAVEDEISRESEADPEAAEEDQGKAEETHGEEIAKDIEGKEDETVLTENKEEEKADTSEIGAPDEESEAADAAEKPLMPRKRKIIKNNQLAVSFCIVLVIMASLFVWKSFFNQSLTGKWFYIHNGTTSETLDDPIASNDSIEQVNDYSQRVVYEFTDDGVCSVTLGTLSVRGTYSTYQTEEGNVLSANVYYQSFPLFYGSYKYDLSGNIFTGRKLTIYGSESEYDIVLEPGEGANPLERYEEEKLDERLTGKWKDAEFDQYYTFTDDGHMIINIEDRLSIDSVYTVFDDGLLLTKYYADTEQTYSYNYTFENDELTLNGNKLVRVE